MDEWMRLTGAKVISAETLPMRIFSGAEKYEGFYTMHTWNKTYTQAHHGTKSAVTHTTEHKASEYHIMLYRVYLDGSYPEPAGISVKPTVED